jgi:hypothetical protein
MKPTKPTEEYSAEETAKRADAALRAALNMPHRPHGDVKKKTKASRRKPGASAKLKTA